MCFQVSRNAAVFGQAAFCTDTRLKSLHKQSRNLRSHFLFLRLIACDSRDTPFTAETAGLMLILIGVAFGLGKAVWGPMLDTCLLRGEFTHKLDTELRRKWN